jgi:predicted Zn-dependent peptidase
VFALAAAAPLAAQSVACEKYTLANGMTVILREDHRVPLVAINTWVRVGAKDEPIGRSGFAHLFEHLMFMGTARVPGNRFDTIMEAAGGSNNASTTEDRTNYFSQGPSSMLPTLLWLDADRLEDLGRTMDQAKLDRQRDVVRNEIRQNVDNAPYGRAERTKFNLMFPAPHPYHDSTYGTHADLEAATVDDVRDFFASFYVPNNASLVVAGDFDPAKVKPLIDALFGTLPRGAEPPRRVVEPPHLDRVVRMTILDQVQMPLVQMVWHAPVNGGPGTAELELLAEVLAEGRDSRLHRRLVEQERLAVDVAAEFDGLALTSLFEVSAWLTPGADLGRVEAIVDEEIERVRKDGVTAEELARRTTSREIGQLASLQDLGRVADQLNRYEFLWGEPNSFARDLARFRAVTTAAVRDVAKSVLDPGRRAILRVLPIEGERAKSLRDERPADFAPAAFAPDMPTELALSNGIRVLHWRRPDLPIVAVRLQIAGEAPLVDPAAPGAAALAAEMLSEGAGDLDAAQFAAELGSLGASVRAWTDHETANATLFVGTRTWKAGLHRMADAVLRPQMRAADFERAREVRLNLVRGTDEEPLTVARRVALRVAFGDQDPYAWPARGTPESVAAFTLEQIKAQHLATYTPRGALFVVAGDVSADEAKKALEAEFGSWRATTPAKPPAALRDPTPAPLRLVLVDRPEAEQTAVQLVMPAPHYRDPARIRLQVLGTVLGGTFTSRLNMNLREQHGYSYGAGASFALGPWRGWCTVATSVQTKVTGPALKELLAELARLRGPKGGDVTADEIVKVQRTMQAQIVQSLQSLDGIGENATELALNGCSFAQLAADIDAIAKITAADVNDASRTDLDLDHGVLVLVGDRRAIVEQLEGLGLPRPEERDVRGNTVPH